MHRPFGSTLTCCLFLSLFSSQDPLFSIRTHRSVQMYILMKRGIRSSDLVHQIFIAFTLTYVII